MCTYIHLCLLLRNYKHGFVELLATTDDWLFKWSFLILGTSPLDLPLDEDKVLVKAFCLVDGELELKKSREFQMKK